MQDIAKQSEEAMSSDAKQSKVGLAVQNKCKEMFAGAKQV